jgi:hypothetical protein
MEYKTEEEHLRHADSPSGIEQINADMAAHFVSGGIEDNSSTMNIPMHSTNSDAAPRDPPAHSQLAQELDEMSKRHAADGDESFVRGVAGVEFAFAEEEEDAE